MSDPTATPDFHGIIESQSFAIEELTERLAELELALEDVGYERLGDNGREFSAAARLRIVEMARLMALKNPLIKRGIAVQVFYVWGQGVTIKAADDRINDVVQAFLDDEKNQAELTSHQAREQKERELQADGEIFFVLFPNANTGRVRVRSIPVQEIADIITDPEDAKSPRYYKRVWQSTEINPTTGRMKTSQQTVYYPDWRYTPKTKPTTIGRHKVAWETPIYHIKVGGFSDWKRGVSEVYAAIDWARAYKEFMEDWATLTRALSRYAWKIATKGGKRGVAAAKDRLGTTLGGSAALGPDTNPPATVGATWIGAEGNDIQPMRTAGATVSMEDGRRLQLMVSAAQGLPETFYGGVKEGSLATASSLDRPTELMMRSRQTLWQAIYTALLGYAVLWAVKAISGPLRGLATVIKEPDGDEYSEILTWKTETVEGDDGTTTTQEINHRVDVTFPAIVAADRKADVEAVVQADTLGGKPGVTFDRKTRLRLLLQALGIPDVDAVMDEVLEALDKEAEQAAAVAAEQAKQAAQAAAVPPAPAPGEQPPPTVTQKQET